MRYVHVVVLIPHKRLPKDEKLEVAVGALVPAVPCSGEHYKLAPFDKKSCILSLDEGNLGMYSSESFLPPSPSLLCRTLAMAEAFGAATGWTGARPGGGRDEKSRRRGYHKVLLGKTEFIVDVRYMNLSPIGRGAYGLVASADDLVRANDQGAEADRAPPLCDVEEAHRETPLWQEIVLRVNYALDWSLLDGVRVMWDTGTSHNCREQEDLQSRAVSKCLQRGFLPNWGWACDNIENVLFSISRTLDSPVVSLVSRS